TLMEYPLSGKPSKNLSILPNKESPKSSAVKLRFLRKDIAAFPKRIEEKFMLKNLISWHRL
ncbi:hypothetical protein DRO54_06885, partial [Candidatus Bathyarchaeota archaeon]